MRHTGSREMSSLWLACGALACRCLLAPLLPCSAGYLRSLFFRTTLLSLPLPPFLSRCLTIHRLVDPRQVQVNLGQVPFKYSSFVDMSPQVQPRKPGMVGMYLMARELSDSLEV